MATVCRLCRDSDIKLISMKDKPLIQFYESVFKIKFYSKDGSPKGFCENCYEKVQKLFEFGKRAERRTKIYNRLAELGLKENLENMTRVELELGLIPLDELIKREIA